MITEPGPVMILAENKDKIKINSIHERIDISINKHHSRGIAIAGHFDCAGNPVSKEVQIQQIKKTITLLTGQYVKLEIIGLWIDGSGVVSPVEI